MEKQSSISSSKFIGSTLDNVILNSNINLTKIKEVLDTLDKATKAIIIPVLKIQKNLSTKFDKIAKDCNETKDKSELNNKETNTQPEESKSDYININDFQFNQKFVNTHEKMISFYENINNNIDLFNKVINSEEYDKLIKGFDQIIPDKEMFAEEEKEKEKEKEKENTKEKEKKKEKEKNKEKNESEKAPKENTKSKKQKRSANKKNSKKSMKKLGKAKGKDKNNSQPPKRKKKDRDLLERLQSEYPSNSYVQKVSKTFLSRRLFKKIIYKNTLNYNEDGSISENRLRSSGESTVYKYCKSIFKFYNDNIINTEKIDEMMGKELKQQFAKIDYEKKEYIIGGKITCSLNELMERVFKHNLLKELFVVEVTLEFYEFYEELVSEFDEKDSNVRIIFCDEKVLKHLREDWINLELVRNYVKQKKENSS